MSGKRNPIADPQPGDIIQQLPSGLLVRVTERNGDCVAFESKSPKGKAWKDENTWTVKGWERVICGDAIVIEQGAKDD